MRFNDITLDGLMKEFEQISKANAEETTEQGYVLPKDLLDQPEAVVDVPYYDEIMKRHASERSKLYEAVADSKILDEAHPKGSTKLEGLSGEETTVEDLQEMKKRFEEVVNSKVKAKKATLHKKLEKLAQQLSDAGHVQFADAVKQQAIKLAEEMPDGSLDSAQHVNVGDEDAFVTNVPAAPPKPKTDVEGMKHVSAIIDMFEQPLMDILGPENYQGTVRSWAGLDKDLRKFFMLYPSNVKNLPAGAKNYSNWQQLAQLVTQGLEEYKSMKMGEEPATTTSPSGFVDVNMDKLRKDLPLGEVDTGHKGPPVAPNLPLTLRGPNV